MYTVVINSSDIFDDGHFAGASKVAPEANFTDRLKTVLLL